MGRRPKADAIRRAHQASETHLVDPGELVMPEFIAENAAMRECWEWTVEGATHLNSNHLPQLLTYCAAWAVARQCIANLQSPSGGVVTKIETPMGVKQHPDIRTMQQATNALRTSAAELGISPLAQTRMGLMKVAAASMAADLPEKVFRILDESRDGD